MSVELHFASRFNLQVAIRLKIHLSQVSEKHLIGQKVIDIMDIMSDIICPNR